MTGRLPGSKVDPFTAGLRSYRRGLPFDPEFGSKCAGWGPISAQCLYERGRLEAAEPDARERKLRRFGKAGPA